MKRKLVLTLGVLSLVMAFLTACSSQPSLNEDGTPSTLQKRYLGSYSSADDTAYYFQESTNEFDFDVKNSTISDGSGVDYYTRKYVVVEEDDLNSALQGQAQKYKDQITDKDTVFYINLDGESTDQVAYEIILSNDGKSIKIIALGAVYEYGDDFVFTGTAAEE